MALNNDRLFADIVGAYKNNIRYISQGEMVFFREEIDIRIVIREAALCRLHGAGSPDSKRHPHQRRIPRATLEDAERRLQSAADKLASATDFAELHDLVESEIGSIFGIGELTVYDIAHRIGAHLRKDPDRIYLHAGTRDGARYLLKRQASSGGGATHLRVDNRTISPDDLPSKFSELTPAEIEDCLCIYANALRDGVLMDDGENTVPVCGHTPQRTRGCK